MGARVIMRLSLGIPSGCAWGDGPGLTETASSLLGWRHPALLGPFAHAGQMEQWFCRLQSRGTEHCRAETAAGHQAGIAAGPAGVRMAGGPKILVLDGYEGCSHKRVVGVWRESSYQGISLSRRHHSRSCSWELELCLSPGQQPASL